MIFVIRKFAQGNTKIYITMNIKTNLFIIFSITLLALGVWLMILFNINPKNADWLEKLAFFGSLLLLLSGTLTFIIFYFRIWFSNKEVIYSYLPIAIRHSVLISFIAVSLLFLNALDVLTWWDGIILVVVIILIELFFQTKRT